MQQIHDNFEEELYMSQKFWEPQLVEELRKHGIDAKQTRGKTDWDIEVCGVPFAELKCQKIQNISRTNELMVAELTGLAGDGLGHFFHIPPDLLFYIIGLVEGEKVLHFYVFDWAKYKKNVENILRHETNYGNDWEDAIRKGEMYVISKPRYKVIPQKQRNGGKKWIMWLHGVFDLETMEIQQEYLRRCLVSWEDFVSAARNIQNRHKVAA